MTPETPVGILVLGLLLGLKHATDPDHIVAVTAIVSRQHRLRHAAMVGISWGIGHTMMIMIVGIGVILLRISIPEHIQTSFELVVAATLVVLGIMNLSGITRKLMDRFGGVHTHLHGHGHAHIHVHSHTEGIHTASAVHENVTEFLGEFGYFHLLRPLIVGIIHGLAGSAAVTLLVLGSIGDAMTGILYLGIFGIGTVIGMMSITTLLGIPIIAGSAKFPALDRWLSAGAGIISIVYGIYYGYGILAGL